MKRLFNIALITFVLVLSGSLSCNGPSFKKTKTTEPNQADNAISVSDFNADIPSSALTSYDSDRTAINVKQDLMSVRETGAAKISRTYPWAECGIVQLDKYMPKEVGLDKPFDYTISITNLTDSILTDITIIEDYSGNFKFISANPVAQEDTNKLSWDISSLGAKSTKQIKITGQATYTDPIKNCTTVVTPVVPLYSNVEVVQPRLKLTKTAPSEALLCDMIPVKFVISNAGTGLVSDIRIVDTLPSGLRTTDGKSELVFQVGSLGSGQSREFSVELRATRTGKYLSKALASSSTGLRVESEETTTVVGAPLLTITKNGPETLYIGRPASYEITVWNKSNVAAKETIVEDTVPEGVSSVQASAGANLSGSKLVWNLGTLAPNSSRTLNISYIPAKAGTLTNDAVAKAYCAEPVTAAMKTVVTGLAAMNIEVVDLEDPVRVGSRATYMIRVTNQGSATANNIRINCTLEDNVKYVSSAGATAGSSEADTVRFLPLGNLAPQAVAVWRVVVAAVKPGDVRFKVSMSSDDLTRPVEQTESTKIYE
jgi:uncharacterized repeat protein (TIGR01451 family)